MHKNLRTWLIAGIVLGAASCKNDDDVIVPVNAPQVTATKTADSVYIGDSTRLHPVVNVKTDVTYKWTVNNAPVGTDSVYSFKPTTSGDFEIVFEAANSAGKNAVTYHVHVWGKYENGFFIISEGNYSAKAGDVNFYDYGLDSVYAYAYTTENPGKVVGPNTSTLQFGTIFNGKLYLVGKFNTSMVVTDANTLKETGRIEELPAQDGRAFLGVDDTRGLLSAADGLYPVTLPSLTLGTKLASAPGEVQDMIKAGNYIFVISATEGLLVLKASDYSLVNRLAADAIAGFVQSKDGTVWAASLSKLIKIDPATLAVETINLGFDIHRNEWTYTNSAIAASATENAIYIASGDGKVYRYLPGNAASLTTPFISLPAGEFFYGKGIGYDKARNYLVVNSNTDMYGSDINNILHIYNASTGLAVHSKIYKGFYFPGMAIFR